MRRVCSRCSIEKDIEDFVIDRSSRRGTKTYCKRCEADYHLTPGYLQARREREKFKRDNCPAYKLIQRHRSRIHSAIKRNRATKKCSSLELLGCTVEEARVHIENKFTSGMTWENMGAWHLDHIRPCSSFDLTDETQQRQCFHYTNLQPLWAKDNLSKGRQYIKENEDDNGPTDWTRDIPTQPTF